MPAFAFKLHSEGVRQLLTSVEVQQDLQRRAQAIATAANNAAGLTDGFVVDVDAGTKRSRAVVITATAEAMIAEAVDRTLSRSIDAGR